jgi:hypothetical protein
MRLGRACSTNREKKNACKILVAEPEVKRPVGRPRRRWGNNIKMDLREIVGGGMDWIYMALDRDQSWAFVKKITTLRVP